MVYNIYIYPVIKSYVYVLSQQYNMYYKINICILANQILLFILLFKYIYMRYIFYYYTPVSDVCVCFVVGGVPVGQLYLPAKLLPIS